MLKPIKITTLILGIFLFAEVINAQLYENSPFAISGLNEMRTGDYTNPVDAGVKWVRLTGENGMFWDKIEILDNGEQLGDPTNYYWDATDKMANEFTQNGFNILWTINSFNQFDQGVSVPTGLVPNDLVSYVKFITAVAERYDGDGIDDAAGSPVINYWQIHNEVNLDFFWSDTPAAYAELFKISYNAIKEANPNAIIALSGLSSPGGLYDGVNNFTDILDELYQIGGTFDIFDIHWYGFVGNYKVHQQPEEISLTDFLNVNLSNALQNFSNVEIWSTENGTYSGSDIDMQSGLAPLQTESAQAGELLKRYIYSLANGIKKIFWKNIEESANYSVILNHNDYYDNIGLVYNGCGIDNGVFTCSADGVGDDLGTGIKKLGFYSYKLMTEKLEGSNWDNIETIIDNYNNKFAYKFINENVGKSVYVAWWDFFDEPNYNMGDSTLVTFTEISANQVLVTSAVPNYSFGINITDYNTAFKIDTLNVTNNSVSFYLKDKPVFMEEYTATSVDNSNFSKDDIKIYPNPTNGIFTIKADDVKSIEITNINGQTTKQLLSDNEDITINLTNKPKGIYLLKITTNKGVSIKKIILK